MDLWKHNLSHVYFFRSAVRSCPPLTRPQHGFLKCNGGGASYRAECQVGCERGYRLEGDSRLTCQANSQWSGPQPRCVGKPSSPQTSISPRKYQTTMEKFWFTMSWGVTCGAAEVIFSISLSLTPPSANVRKLFSSICTVTVFLFQATHSFACVHVFAAQSSVSKYIFGACSDIYDLISKGKVWFQNAERHIKILEAQKAPWLIARMKELIQKVPQSVWTSGFKSPEEKKIHLNWGLVVLFVCFSKGETWLVLYYQSFCKHGCHFILIANLYQGFEKYINFFLWLFWKTWIKTCQKTLGQSYTVRNNGHSHLDITYWFMVNHNDANTAFC